MGDLKSKEQRAWDDWETAVKPGNGRVTLLWIALIILVAITGAVSLAVFGRPYNQVQYIVATPTRDDSFIRFLCYHNNGQLLPSMGVVWQRENGQTVDAVTDGTGCVIVPANETIGVWNHVTQVTTAVWPGARPVCLNISTGIVESGSLCPPGYNPTREP